jgi:type IV secretion system protein VirD4
VAQALQDIARDAEASQTGAQRLKQPALFLLDEFAALGRLEAVERAMGLMAGYGLQLWPILQDMSQLKDLYGARANTFVANAGVLQTFGVNDFETARWLSQMIGREPPAIRPKAKPGDAPSTSYNVTARDLMTPDEIMQIPPNVQLLRVQGKPVMIAASCATLRTGNSTGSTRHRMRNPQIPNLNPDRATPISDPTAHIPDHGSHNAQSRFCVPCPISRQPR